MLPSSTSETDGSGIGMNGLMLTGRVGLCFGRIVGSEPNEKRELILPRW
jgi:hypothetical protein